ncbi:hypothetical protein ACVMIX_004396 [Rhizobium leguminosarum]
MANTNLQINRPDDLQGLNVISPEPAYNPKSQSVFGENHLQIQSDRAQRVLEDAALQCASPESVQRF